MTMLAERIDAVIGVDTHKATHTAAVVTPTGGVTAHLTVPSDTAGSDGVVPAADPGNWQAWPISMLPVALIGLLLAWRVWHARPKAETSK